MTKIEIARALHTRIDRLPMNEAAELVDLVFETMKEMLGRGETIEIADFGNFVLRDKRERPGRNPQTGEAFVVAARRVLRFKESTVLKSALNPRKHVAPAVAAEE